MNYMLPSVLSHLGGMSGSSEFVPQTPPGFLRRDYFFPNLLPADYHSWPLSPLTNSSSEEEEWLNLFPFCRNELPVRGMFPHVRNHGQGRALRKETISTSGLSCQVWGKVNLILVWVLLLLLLLLLFCICIWKLNYLQIKVTFFISNKKAIWFPSALLPVLFQDSFKLQTGGH